MQQQTLKESFSLTGKGLHTGINLTVTFNPAPENHGYKIQRIDLENEPIIDAIAENVIETQRGTVLGRGDVSVSTVEHGMAALYAAQIDNCLITINGPEFPILNGSSILYTQEIERVGKEQQKAKREYYIVKKKIQITDPDTGSSIEILPDDHFSVNILISFDSPILNNQFAVLNNMDEFATEISSSRTFCFVREIEPLLNNNLIKGGDLDNAIVIYDKVMEQSQLDRLADLMHVPHKNVNHLGYINNKPLTCNNEPARHKLLDIMGDFALIGRQIKGRVIATRPGHKINVQMARQLRREIKRTDMQAPIYDLEKKPIMDINRIKELLPHRYPFLLVDKIIDLGSDFIVGVKNFTVNEPFFQGHFPQEPVTPGVLLVEAMAQTGGLLVLSTVENPALYSTYFLKIDNVKFRHKVLPGDTVIFHLSLLSEVRRGCAYMKGIAFVGEKIVTEAEFMAQVVKS